MWGNLFLSFRLFSVVADRGLRSDAVGVGGFYGMTIEDCVLTRINGTSPQARIDVEPEPPDPVDVLIRRCRSEAPGGHAAPVERSGVEKETVTQRKDRARHPQPQIQME
jgi:hypothetical protein